MTPDPITQSFRVNSGAFKPGGDGTISIDLEQLLQEDGFDRDAMYPSIANAVGLIGHAVATMIGHGVAVRHDPIRQNWYHGILADMLQIPRKQRDRVSRELARQYDEVVPVDQDAARRHWEAVRGEPAFPIQA